MKTEQARAKHIDYTRAIAICLVVLNHATESIYALNLDNILSISIQSIIFGFICFTMGRLGVPLFLMITGYLFLDRNYDSETTKRFWKKNWLHLLLCTEIWFLIYDIFLSVYNHKPLDILILIEDMLFLHRVNFSHVWYLPTILGLYILIPYVSFSLKSLDHHLLKFPVIIFSIYGFIFPVLNVINKVVNPDLPLSMQFSMGFSGGVYGLYLIYGYITKTGAYRKIKTLFILIISLLSFSGAVFLQLWSYKNNIVYNIWYDNFLLLLTAICLFELISRLKTFKGYRFISFISKYSFAIYLIHNICRTFISPYVKTLPFRLPIKIGILWAGLMIFSLVLSIIISKIPKVGKFILYLK